MITIKNLTKLFEGKKILDSVNIEFETGKINFIIGKSGSGKSTIIKCIVGLLEINKGYIYFDDLLINTASFKEQTNIRKKIGMLFQASALFDSLTVEENIKLPLELHSKLTKKEILKRVNFCLNKVNIENANHLYPSDLSGGMKKRVGLARAIALKPKFLICDEPNSGLDPKSGIIIDELIHDITKEFNTTTIIVTHDMNSVINIGDNINFIHDGKIWWQGAKNTILKTDNKELNDFIYPTKLMKQIKNNTIK